MPDNIFHLEKIRLPKIQSPKSADELRNDERQLKMEQMRRMESASILAGNILSAFPDYGKASSEYTSAIIKTIMAYPELYWEAFSNLQYGVASKTSFLPTPAHFAEVAKERRPEIERVVRLVEMDKRFSASGVKAAEKPEVTYRSRERFYDKYHNEISPREAEVRKEEHRINIESMRRVEKMLKYVKELGNGDALEGWAIAIERGIDEPPADWSPTTSPQEKSA